MRSWWLPAVTGLAGLLAGWWLASRPEEPPASPVTSASTSHAQGSSREVSPAAPSAVSLEDLRRVVREELAAAGGHTPTPGPSTAAGEPGLPTPAQNAALMRASQLLDSAMARRQWTDADVQAIRAEFHQLTVEQQVEVMRQYAMAVNQGRIVPQTDQVPF